jgi:hypothetical protein
MAGMESNGAMQGIGGGGGSYGGQEGASYDVPRYTRCQLPYAISAKSHLIALFIWLSFMYFELYLCLIRHLCAMHARQSFCKVEG